MKISFIALALCLAGLVAIPAEAQKTGFRVISYNVENLFDMSDDPGTDDEEYCYKGKKFWTQLRYQTKLRNIAEVIRRINYSYTGPDIVVMTEVENRKVLETLLGKTELAEKNYGIIHGESGDSRGIDVAMIYDTTFFTPLKTEFYRIKEFHTRDIVYTSFQTPFGDTLHIFGVHFPSMRGGKTKTDEMRMVVAGELKNKVDSLYAGSPHACIMVCGDFNCVSGNIALERMRVLNPQEETREKSLYDLGYAYKGKETVGTYCYKGEWQTLDHILVSTSLKEGNGGYRISSSEQQIYSEKFLLEENKKMFGWEPFPTYRGRYYMGGYSDHLPIYIDIVPAGN